MAYKITEDTFWTDPDLKHLTFEVHSFLGYLITNRHAHYSGIYYLPKSFMVEETRLAPKKVNDYLGALAVNSSGKFYALYDEKRHIIWVKNMLIYQAKHTNRKNTLLGTAKQLETLHGTPLIREFLGHYYNKLQNWMTRYTFKDDEREALSAILTAPMPGLPSDSATMVPVEAPETPVTPPKALAPTKVEGKEPEPVKTTYGEFENVKLLDVEYDKLLKRFGEGKVKEKIEELSGGIRSIYGTKKYKDHYATLTVWIKRELKDKEGNMPERPTLKECTKENPMPEGAKMSEWRHPKILKRMNGDRCTAAKCKYCAMEFPIF